MPDIELSKRDALFVAPWNGAVALGRVRDGCHVGGAYRAITPDQAVAYAQAILDAAAEARGYTP